MTTKVFDGANWLLIYYHNSETGLFFDNDSASFINNEYQYSIIGSITERFKHNGNFEYLLEYPEQNGFNRWKQKIHISDTNELQTPEDIGYTPVHIDFTQKYNNIGFGGLSKSNSIRTVFDGSPANGASSDNYWFAIGPKEKYYNKNQFPGPYYGEYADGVTKCYLWIRISGIFPTCRHFLYNKLSQTLYLFITISQ